MAPSTFSLVLMEKLGFAVDNSKRPLLCVPEGCWALGDAV